MSKPRISYEKAVFSEVVPIIEQRDILRPSDWIKDRRALERVCISGYFQVNPITVFFREASSIFQYSFRTHSLNQYGFGVPM